VSNDEIGPELTHDAIQVQQLAHPAMTHRGEHTGDAGSLKLGPDVGEVVLLRKQRCHADFMTVALVKNGKTLY
jgi:hypothetical protein